METAPRNRGILEQPRARLIAALAIAAVGAIAWLMLRPGEDAAAPDRLRIPGEEIPGHVEVLNGTDRTGFARATTRTLRLAGIDVVFFGTHRPEIDSTVVIMHTGDSTLARLIRSILGAGRITVDPDSSRFVDVTVLLGYDLPFDL